MKHLDIKTCFSYNVLFPFQFPKPSTRENFDYPQMVEESIIKALADAKITCADVQRACIGYSRSESTSGQRSLNDIGLTDVPTMNVNSQGSPSTGLTALTIAKLLIKNGSIDCVLAVGLEKMLRDGLSTTVSQTIFDYKYFARFNFNSKQFTVRKP